jgi:hypothetical protein
MSATLNNVQTSDRFTDAATLLCPGTVQLKLVIANAMVEYQLGQGSPPAWDEDPTQLPPVTAGLARRCDAIRFRSAAAGTPARVIAIGLTAAEVGEADVVDDGGSGE